MYILILFILSVIAFLVSFAEWAFDCDQIDNKIKFKPFMSFYNVNPDRWNLHDGYVSCNNPKSWWNIKFKFNYFDWIRYKRFCRNKEKRDKFTQSNKDYATMIALVKIDIANLEAKSQEEMLRAAQDIKTIVNRM